MLRDPPPPAAQPSAPAVQKVDLHSPSGGQPPMGFSSGPSSSESSPSWSSATGPASARNPEQLENATGEENARASVMRALSGVSEVVSASRRVDEEARAAIQARRRAAQAAQVSRSGSLPSSSAQGLHHRISTQVEAMQASLAQRALNRSSLSSAYSLPAAACGRPGGCGQPPKNTLSFPAVLESLYAFTNQQLLVLHAELERQMSWRGLAAPPQKFADATQAQHWQQQQASDTLLLLRTLQQAQLLRQRSVEEPGTAAVPWPPLNDWKGNLGAALSGLVSGSGLSSTGTADTQLPTPFADPVRQAAALQRGYANDGTTSPLGSAASLEGPPQGGWAPPAGLLPAQRSSGPGLTREQLAAAAAHVQQQATPAAVDESGGSAAVHSATRHS